MSTVLKAAITIGIALVILLVVGRCKDTDATIANAVHRERMRVIDSMTVEKQAAADSQRAMVTVRVDTVRRSITRWDTVTLASFDTVYATDSAGERVPAVPLPQYEAVVLAGDSLKRSCSLLAQTCEALRDSVPRLVELYRKANAARDSVIAHPPPPRRWSLCASAGYGAVLGNPVATGPSLNVGLCYRIW